MKLVVAGAGLGGLAAALACAKAGAAVTVLERAPALTESGAGVQLSPNATRALRALGVLDALLDTAVAVNRVRVRRWRDGADLAEVPTHRAEARYGAPFLVAHRADVQAALLSAIARDASVVLHTGRPLLGLSQQAGGVTVRADGLPEPLNVDGLVGADGLRSHTRSLLGATDPLRFSGRMAWRALIPAAGLAAEWREPASQLWLGPHAHLVHYPVRAGTLINVVAIVDRSTQDGRAPDDWSTPGAAETLLRRFSGWSHAARDLLGAAPDWRVWPLFDRAPAARWTTGRVTLLGDAAHPMLPFLAQGAAQALDDARTLGEAVARHADFAVATATYERARRPLASRVQRESRMQGRIYHLAGPLAAARDLAFGLLAPERMLARYDWLYGAPAAS